jgi:hypothetical protein
LSFHTSLMLYRPGKPPLVRGPELARFVREMEALGALSGRGLFRLEVKYGEAIDEDDADDVSDDEWDVDEDPGSVNGLVSALERLERPIYRAFLMMGGAPREIFLALWRPPSTENRVELLLSEWSLGLGPVAVADLESVEIVHPGWMELGISGRGYLYPWTFRDLIGRAESSPKVQAVAELCRRSWPVDPGPPDEGERRLRKKLGELWPYDMDRIRDWAWGLEESG